MPDFYKTILFLVLLTCTVQLLAHGPVHESIVRLTKSIEQAPDSADLYLQRGQFYQIDGDFDRAFTDYNKAKKLLPNLLHTDVQIAKLFLENKYSNSALLYVNPVLEKKPDHVGALMTRAAIYTALNENELAASDFETAILHVKEPRPEHYIAISKAVIMADSTNYKESVQWLQKGEEVLGDNIVLRTYAIDLAVSHQVYDEALSMTNSVIEKMPRKEKWLFRKAEILETAGQIDEAIAACEQASIAISQLPRHIQGTRSVSELEAQIAMKLIKLTNDNINKNE